MLAMIIINIISFQTVVVREGSMGSSWFAVRLVERESIQCKLQNLMTGVQISSLPLTSSVILGNFLSFSGLPFYRYVCLILMPVPLFLNCYIFIVNHEIQSPLDLLFFKDIMVVLEPLHFYLKGKSVCPFLSENLLGFLLEFQ